MSASEIATRFNDSNPCPVCGTGSKGCSATTEGLYFCRGEPNDPNEWRQVADNGTFVSYRKFDRSNTRSEHKPGPKGNPGPSKDWAAETERFAGLTDPSRQQLADCLRLPADALAALRVGWDGAAWTFPECDGGGRIVGISRRYPDGKKSFHKGGERGLTLPAEWNDRRSTLFVVEGPSDVLAMSHAGLYCVGRPSNTGWADPLAVLLKGWPKGRGLVVVGENDRKPDGSWPGRDGAVKVAAALAAKLGRPVPFAFPPSGVKDVREWLTADSHAGMPWPERGAKLREHLEANTEAVPHGKPHPPPIPSTSRSRSTRCRRHCRSSLSRWRNRWTATWRSPPCPLWWWPAPPSGTRSPSG